MGSTKVITNNLIQIFSLLMLASVFSASEKRINSWQELFPDHLERVYVVMKDGATFPHTSQDEAMVDMSIGRLEEELKKKDYSIKDIMVVIHNHRMSKRFSHEDYKQYWTLKGYGFDGQFLLYCHRTNKTYCMKN